MIYRSKDMQRLKAFKDSKIIKVVAGLRRARKATLQREVAPFYSTPDFFEKTIITADKTYVSNANGIKIVNLIDFLLS